MRASLRALLGSLIVAAAAWVLLDVLVWRGAVYARLMQGRGEPVAVEVAGRRVTTEELGHALREHLWRRSESWSALDEGARQERRKAVLEDLVDARLIRQFRLKEQGGNPPPETVGRRESEILRRQFVTAEDYASRLAGQQQTQKSLDAEIREAQLDEAWIAQKTSAKVNAITDREARLWYERFKETLRIPQAHHAAHLFLTRQERTPAAGEARIREFHRQIVAGEKTFFECVAAHSEDTRTKGQGGDLGWFTRERMPVDFIAAVEKVEIGKLSGPIVTALGWHLVLVRERRASRLPDFAEVRAEIRELLIAQRRAEAVKDLLADLHQRCEPPLRLDAAVMDAVEPLP